MKKITTDILDFHDEGIVNIANYIVNRSKQGGFGYVVTPNIDHMMRLCESSELKRLYQDAELRVCDSRVLKLLMRLKGVQLENVITGSSLTKTLFDHHITSDMKVLIFGCDDDSVSLLRDRYRTFDIRHINPSMGFIYKDDEVVDCIRKIKEISPNLIFLSVGSPQQEVFAKRILDQSGVEGCLALCVGASINFLVDKEQRAPVFVQSIGMEWLFRLLQNPKRLWSRYWKNFLALRKVYISL